MKNKRYPQSSFLKRYRTVNLVRAVLPAVLAASLLTGVIYWLGHKQEVSLPVLTDQAAAPSFSPDKTPEQMLKSYEAVNTVLSHSYLVREKLLAELEKIKQDYNDGIGMHSEAEFKQAVLATVRAAQDKYTGIFSRQKYEDVTAHLCGKIIGCPVKFTWNAEPKTITIFSVVSGSKAEKLGLMTGDELVRIDGYHIDELKAMFEDNEIHITDAITSIFDHKLLGTKVPVTIKRDGKKYNFELEVEVIDQIEAIRVRDFSTAQYNLPFKFGITQKPKPYVGRLISVYHVEDNDFIKQWHKMLESLSADKVDAILIDLCAIRGGNGEKAMRAAAMLMERGVIGHQIVPVGKTELEMDTYYIEDGKVHLKKSGPYIQRADGSLDPKPQGQDVVSVLNWPINVYKGKVAVLVDIDTQGCSELLAGILWDNERALIVGIGRHTAGKGLGQTIYNVSPECVMFCTTSYYLLPRGWGIDQGGIPVSVTANNVDQAAQILTDQMNVVPYPELPDGN